MGRCCRIRRRPRHRLACRALADRAGPRDGASGRSGGVPRAWFRDQAFGRGVGLTVTREHSAAMGVTVPHHGPVRIADFALERYFARWEFAAEHLLCASDVEPFPMADLLELADDETRALWDGLR